MVEAIADRHRDTDALCIVGIALGGIVLGRRLAAGLGRVLGRAVDFGILDISFHRDDIGTKPFKTITFPTDLPFGVDSATVIVADDVMESGRTIRAALGELFDQGRPDRVELAILCDRGNRSLPFQPEFTGFVLATDPAQVVRVHLDEDNTANDRIEVQ